MSLPLFPGRAGGNTSGRGLAIMDTKRRESMSTTLTTSASWYRVGAAYGMPGTLGYDYAPLVGRFKFHTPSTGATELSFASEKYQIYGGEYTPYDFGYHFLVTAESSGYEAKWGTDIGSPTVNTGNSMTGSVTMDLMPDRDYYLWVWPRYDAYYRMAPGEITVTVDGIYGTPSGINASDGAFGSQIPVSLAVSTEGAVHDLRVSCAGRTETLMSRSTATSCVWTLDLTTYAALLPNSGSAQAVFTCETFFNGNSVGSTTKTITLRFAQGSLPPTLSTGWAAAAVYNTGTAAAGISVYVQGISKAQVSFDSTKISCKNGASVASFRIRCNGVTVNASPYRTDVLTGNAEILCTVTDSRGQEASETLQITVQPYAEPRLTEVTVFRCDSMGDPADDGQYYSAKGKGLYSSLSGQNSMTLTVAHKRTEDAAFGTETTLQNDTAMVIGTISADSSYLVRLTVTDALGKTASVTVALATQHWAMKFRPGGMGVGFGKAPEHDNCIELPSGWVIRIGSTVVASE